MKQTIRNSLLGFKDTTTTAILIVLIVGSAGLSGCSCDDDKTPVAADANEDAIKCEGGDCASDTGIPNARDGGNDVINQPVVPDASPDGADKNDGAPGSCYTDEECDNGNFCDGVERCVFDDNDAGDEGFCFRPIRGPCDDPIDCNEELDTCNCDLNDNGERSFACGGHDCDDDDDQCGDEIHCPNWACLDCDDQDPERNYWETEICDDEGRDEDCDWKTIRNLGTLEDGKYVGTDGDEDGDEHIDERCFNIDPDGKPNRGDDCDDTRSNINPKVSEICDNVDNDCDGLTDEDHDDNAYGLRTMFCVDADGDGWGNKEKKFASCFKPDGYVFYDSKAENDCDDHDDKRRPQNDEICDGKDNDCDGETDEPDREGGLLFDQPSFTNTVVLCDSDSGEYYIPDGGCPPDKLHCSDNINLGCETFATTLSTCRACETNCLFSCGEQGCDEIDFISVGQHHACAITKERVAACWGRNVDGQLGNDYRSSSSIPTRVIGIGDDGVSDVSAGYSHTCAIVGDKKTVYCWGKNKKRQLGTSNIAEFVQIPEKTLGGSESTNLENATSIAAGTEHTCAVYNEGTVGCWGNPEWGRLGNGDDEIAVPLLLVKVRDLDRVYVENGMQVVVGDMHSCLVTEENKVLCWGDNYSGQVGVDPDELEASYHAREVSGLEDITMLAAGPFHTCSLSFAGEVKCWGDNYYLQLGRLTDDEYDYDYEPAPVSGIGTDIIAIAAGADYSCALRENGELLCWGSNYNGERGDDDPIESADPTIVNIGSVKQVASGGVSCAIESSGAASCWGDNFFGQLGNGETSSEPQYEPVTISALKGSAQ